MLNPLIDVWPNAAYFGFARTEYTWFGSGLDVYPAERIAAIHDGCGYVLPNVYSSNRVQEASDIHAALDRGADGVMVNNPDVGVAAISRPVATRIEISDATACLQGHQDVGLPGKTVTVDGSTRTTGKGGCVSLTPAPSTSRAIHPPWRRPPDELLALLS